MIAFSNKNGLWQLLQQDWLPLLGALIIDPNLQLPISTQINQLQIVF
ncbi:hypothetical protein NG798_26760 [Ancylothrix sp. C2]|nr:hypothetical protein [Ancylothrix sp. D3o]MCT7953406.1 hypothetical protein [Ancylothrix sp. D3o]